MLRLSDPRAALALLGCGLVLLVVAPLDAEPAATLVAAQESGARYVGKRLSEALEALETQGLNILFSSELVRPEMRVEVEPARGTAREVLEALLAPHGLTALEASDGSLVVVAAAGGLVPSTATIRGTVVDHETGMPLPGAVVVVGDKRTLTTADGGFEIADLAPGKWDLSVEVAGYAPSRRRLRLGAGERKDLSLEVDKIVVSVEEIIVTPSRVDIAQEEPLTLVTLDRQEVLALPNPTGDVFRAAGTVPGTASNDLSARFAIRGGREDEVLVLLDGLELYEPYHLQDLNSALSIVAPQVIDSLELSAGGYSVANGDRLSGLMSIRTVRPDRFGAHLGLTAFDASGGLSGLFAEGRGSWLLTGRRGLIERTLELADRQEEPRFWDLFGKISYSLTDSQEIRLETTLARDEFSLLTEIEDDLSTYDNRYVWANHQALVGSNVLVETIVSLGQLDHDREGYADADLLRYQIDDRRFVDLWGVRQDWAFQPTPNQSLKWGWSERRIDSDYDYQSFVERQDLWTQVGGATDVESLVDLNLSGRQGGAYFAYRARPVGALTAELGVRYDDNRLADDEHWSPRLNLAYSTGRRGVLRFTWGAYYQSQRPHELEVGDGEVRLKKDEHADLLVAGYERVFFDRDFFLRAEVYRRDVDHPRPHYENLFDPVAVFPEVEPDRVQIAPDNTTAEGFELFVRHDLARRFRWRLSYSLSRIEDDLAGVKTPRGMDQTHALRLALDSRFGDKWGLNVVWDYHTGWPTTSLTLETDPEKGTVLPVLGPFYQERLRHYHRLDVRVARQIKVPRGRLTLTFDILNLYNRRNIRGFELLSAGQHPGESPVLRSLSWGGQIPTLGVRWEL